MKKSIIVSAVTFLFAAAADAQSTEASVKNEMGNLNNTEFAAKKEKRDDKKELRKQEDQEVSYQAKQEFYQDFGNISVIQWERTANFDEATYTQYGQTS